MIQHRAVGALCLIAAATCLTSAAKAQTPVNTVLTACYVPASGTVYRVGAQGLPGDCFSPTHVRFSWNSQGIQGNAEQSEQTEQERTNWGDRVRG